MENITEFKDKNEIHEELLEIFKDIHKYILNQNIISISNEDILELINRFYIVYEKLKNNKWSNPSDIIFLKKFNSVTSDDNKFDEYMNKMEYIKVYDILRKDLIKLNEEQIRLLILSTSAFDDLDDNIYKSIIDCFSNSLIMKDLNETISFKDRVNKFVDYIECIQDGENPVIISLENNNKVPIQIDKMDSGIFTIDRIYNYYINKIDGLSQILGLNLDINIIININRIKYIKKLNSITQTKFIELIKIIKNLKLGLLKEIEGVSDSVEIFIHFKDEIDKIDIETLNNLFSFMFINKLNINEVDNLYRRL